MTPLRIAFLLDKFPSISETFITNQIVDLLERGHSVKIFSLKESNENVIHQTILNYKLQDNVTFKRERENSKVKNLFNFIKYLVLRPNRIYWKKFYKNFIPLKYSRIASFINIFNNYSWILLKEDFDIFHAHFGHNGEYIARMKKSGYLKETKLITSFHGYDIHPAKLDNYKAGYKNLKTEGELFLCNSIYSASIVEKIFNKNKIKILPVGLDTSKFRSKNKIKRDGTFKVLFVGRLVELKGVHLALKIIKKVVDKGFTKCELRIVGEGEEYLNIKNQIIELSLEENVKIFGALSQTDIIELMDDTHLFFMPGVYDKSGRAETQGLVIQEAQAMKLPVLVSDVGGMKYGLIDGKTGFVIKENDIDEFAEKIIYFINDEEARVSFGIEGRKLVEELYDSKVLGKRLENLYLSL